MFDWFRKKTKHQAPPLGELVQKKAHSVGAIFITFRGPTASGKTLIARRLEELLRSEGIEVVVRSGFPAELGFREHSQKKIEELSPIIIIEDMEEAWGTGSGMA